MRGAAETIPSLLGCRPRGPHTALPRGQAAQILYCLPISQTRRRLIWWNQWTSVSPALAPPSSVGRSLPLLSPIVLIYKMGIVITYLPGLCED